MSIGTARALIVEDLCGHVDRMELADDRLMRYAYSDLQWAGRIFNAQVGPARERAALLRRVQQDHSMNAGKRLLPSGAIVCGVALVNERFEQREQIL